MALFGSRSDGTPPGQPRGRKSKRRWTPEPGAAQARSWRDAAAPRAEHGSPPPPTRVQRDAAEHGSPPTRVQRDAAEHGGPPPARFQRPAPPRAGFHDGRVPNADEAPTAAAPTHHRPPPARGARPYDPHRTEPVRREPPPRGGFYQGERHPGSGEYEHYDTGGYAGEPRPQEQEPPREEPRTPGGTPKLPKKITVTRVAAMRSRQLTGQAVDAFQRATKADGAEKSGLTSLTYAVMLNYASDAAMAIALANTLFFAATSGESKGKVALYLLITIAPFALVAPVIGPALDKVQRGRRLAMCASSIGQGLMAVVMALHFDDWLLYPAALGMMVLSKSFTVLKAAVTPRVLPSEITLSKTNARLTTFGLVAAGVFGALASGVNAIAGSAGALWFTALICVAAAVQSMRIPAWVEATEGEVPTSLSAHPKEKKRRQPMGRHIVVALWGNGSVRVLTGFLMMFAAFAVKAQTEGSGQTPFMQLLLLGVIGAAAGAGGFLGNALGSRLHFGSPDQVIVGCVAGCVLAALVATILPGLATAAIVGLIGATASALAKISLDAVIQEDLPEESRASAFGRSETVLQLAWCLGGAIGLLLPPTYWIGFLVISILLAVGLTQTYLVRRGGSLVPGLGGDRPLRPEPTGSFPAQGLPRDPTARR
ncbi:Predicted arabinose efflux permease, MFS family [Amycolatopsis tolypomycina]|uniref:Predicted arabinose efflux permease, MFS family n=1 Tax=Amycolatopsis tolypomycina TaxID=208445 RepID=A0A1H5CX81_9PSEU|nr:MFS transporter [Amycolatopsis tolypomycina]SED71104.1 Predicted arabinose efflux permease, MFS family [Amycolatopsis tolypomycina]